MKSSISPFKKKSHSREPSQDSHKQHGRAISGSTHSHHSRNVSNGGGGNPPVSGTTVSASHKRSTSRSSNASSTNSNFLAEQYDKDRRAIIQCCFSKFDSKTNLPPNNYMTHVRVIEDAKYPSSRPGSDTKLDYKKKRVLILSSMPNNPKMVKIHKARENSDGTFQIGRTWNLKDLTKIEKDTEVHEGFLLTMGKTYYWQTNSAKERTVFIKTLVKFYSQTFDGHVPLLINWDLATFYLDEKSYKRSVIHIPSDNKDNHSYNANNNNNININTARSNIQPNQQMSTASMDRNINVQKNIPAIAGAIASADAISSFSHTNNGNATINNTELPMKKVRDNYSNNQNQTTQRQNNNYTSPSSSRFPPSLNKTPYSTNNTINQISKDYEEEAQEKLRLQAQAEEQARQIAQREAEAEARQQAQAQAEAEARQIAQVQAREKAKRQEEAVERARLQAQHEAQSIEQSRIQEERDYNDQAQNGQHSYKHLIGNEQKVSEPDHISIESHDEEEKGQHHDEDINREDKDHLLEDLNTMLSGNENSENFNQDYQPEKNISSESETLPLHLTQTKTMVEETEPITDPIPFSSANETDDNVDLNSPPSSAIVSQRNSTLLNDAQEDRDVENPEFFETNQTGDTTNDLSFERGDEVRYSQILEPQTSHQYHEVTTIQEEDQNANLPDMNEESSKPDVAPKNQRVQVKDEILLESLTDVNWELDDDADTLISKLEGKLTNTVHSFNTDLLGLQKIGSSLEPYEKNVEHECSKMNPAFSLFLMELNNFSQDIEYVEAQGNGLQVESANKKMLWNTLSNLLSTVSLDENTLKELLKCPIRERNLPWMETQLVLLSSALKAISGEDTKDDYNLRDMEALKKRHLYYEKVTELFLERVVKEMGTLFANIRNDGTTTEQLVSILQRLLVYSPLIVFCKEISKESYNSIVENWTRNIHLVYSSIWNRTMKTMNIEMLVKSESEKGFSQQTNTDRILTQWQRYKKTRALTFDEPLHLNLLKEVIQLFDSIQHHCTVYQNFIDKFFHISSNLSFSEFAVKFKDPNSRIVPLDDVKPMDSDRESANTEVLMVSKIFQSIISQMTTFITEVSKNNQSLLPSVMFALEKRINALESSNQEFLFTAFKKIFNQLKQTWYDFTDKQLLSLGRIISNDFNRVIFPPIFELPMFIKDIEDSLNYTRDNFGTEHIQTSKTNKLLTDVYRKLSSEVIKVLDSKSTHISVINLNKQPLNETALNETITLLTNYNWLIEILTMLNSVLDDVFEDAIQKSKKAFDKEKDIYASHLLQNAMPKLKSFVDGANHVLENSTSNSGASNGTQWGAYSRKNLEITLNAYSSKEIRLLVQSLHKHLDKDMTTGQPKPMKELLYEKLWSCLQGQTVSLYLKLYTLIEKQYHGVLIKFSKNDIISAFDEYKA